MQFTVCIHNDNNNLSAKRVASTPIRNNRTFIVLKITSIMTNKCGENVISQKFPAENVKRD